MLSISAPFELPFRRAGWQFRACGQAEREILDDKQIRVKFKETVFSIFGLELFRKATKGSGVWTQRFVDAGLRVMNTPSLFVLRKRRA